MQQSVLSTHDYVSLAIKTVSAVVMSSGVGIIGSVVRDTRQEAEQTDRRTDGQADR